MLGRIQLDIKKCYRGSVLSVLILNISHAISKKKTITWKPSELSAASQDLLLNVEIEKGS